MGGWGVFLGLRIFFLKIFHQKIKSVQNGLKCKKTHKTCSSSEQLLPKSNSPGPEYLNTLGPGHPFSSLGRCSIDRSSQSCFIFLTLITELIGPVRSHRVLLIYVANIDQFHV